MSAYRDAGLFVLLASTWGSAFAGIKIGVEYIPPLLFAAFRYDIAAAILFAYILSTSDRVRPRGRAEWLDLCLSGLFIVAALQGFLAYGEQFITSAIAAIIVSMGPIITTGLARIVLPDEGLSHTGILGLLIGFIGVGIVTRPSPDLLLAEELLGKLSILAAVVCLSIGTVLTRVVEEDIELSVSVREAWAMGIGAIALHVSSVAINEPISAVQFTTPGVGAVIYLAVVPSVVGYFIYFDLLNRLGAIEVNLVLYLTPVVAALIGWAILGERLEFLTIIGFITIFLGFVMIKSGEISGLLE
jgi:drug/metabolite transporter (DMT)-like permease